MGYDLIFVVWTTCVGKYPRVVPTAAATGDALRRRASPALFSSYSANKRGFPREKSRGRHALPQQHHALDVSLAACSYDLTDALRLKIRHPRACPHSWLMLWAKLAHLLYAGVLGLAKGMRPRRAT